MQIKQGNTMHVIIWEYRVKAEYVARFEEIYARGGAWTKLFQNSEGYLETELLRDPGDPYRYITIDRWTTTEEYETFLSQWKTEYAAVDAQCEDLTEREILCGRLEMISHEAR
jgi:heme-degrading monooxygenase HmoA